MDKEIWIVRHGETEFNRRGIIQGRGVDSSLNEQGRFQAARFYDTYGSVRFDRIYISTLQRTRQTIEPFIKPGIPLEIRSEIDEIDWGIHEGQEAGKWIIDSYNRLINEWKNGNLDASVENGESGQMLINRVRNFVDSIRDIEAKRILVCTHGRTIRCMMSILENGPPSSMEDYKHANTGLFLIHLKNGQFTTLKNNDRSHMNNIDQ